MVKEKVFFFDMDGTLLPHGENQTISNDDIYALNELEKKGYKVVLNTGKSLSMCKSQLELFDFKTTITSNGQVIFDRDENVYDGSFEADEIDYWIGFAKDNNLHIGFQTNKEQYILEFENTDKYRKLCFENLNVELPTFLKEFDYNIKVQQIWLLGEVDGISLRSDFDYFRWHEFAFDVQLKGINKGSALTRILDFWKLENCEVYTFGDGVNDLDMFKLADVSVAMGNASESVKKLATEVTDDVTNSGVCKFLVNNNII